MTKSTRQGLALICYGLATLMVGGFLYAFDSQAVESIGGAVAFVGGVVVLVGLVGLGRSLTVED